MQKLMQLRKLIEYISNIIRFVTKSTENDGEAVIKGENLESRRTSYEMPNGSLAWEGRENTEVKVLPCADTTVEVSLSVVASEEDENEKPVSLRISVLGSPGGQMRRKLLILDLNGLLVDIVSPPPKEYKADIKIAKQAIFKRPFCVDFLKFCFQRFEVGIWSSRTKKNLERMIEDLMGDMKHQLLFCWDLSHCTASGFKSLENKHKALVFKELKRIWEKHDPNLPWEKGDYDESNTLLLDDSPYKGLINPPHTAAFPYSYKFQDRNDTSLGPGGDLYVYLEHLAESENVPKFIEQHPFGQSPISEESAYWDFYLKVLNKFYSSSSTT